MRLILKTIIVENATVRSFLFVSQEPVKWQAGQSIRLELPVGYDLHERRFSIASAPHEGVIRVTTRLSESKFKQALWALQPGAIVQAFSIEGRLLLYPGKKQIFLAGGLGITPIRALLSEAALNHPENNMIVVCTARKGGHLFSADLERWRKAMPGISLIQKDRRLADRDVRTLLDEDALYYLAGPVAMVADVRNLLLKSGIKATAIQSDLQY